MVPLHQPVKKEKKKKDERLHNRQGEDGLEKSVGVQMYVHQLATNQ